MGWEVHGLFKTSRKWDVTLLTSNTVMYVKPAAVVTSIGMDQSLQYPIRLYKNLKHKRQVQNKKRFNTTATSLGLGKALENGSFCSHCEDKRNKNWNKPHCLCFDPSWEINSAKRNYTKHSNNKTVGGIEKQKKPKHTGPGLEFPKQDSLQTRGKYPHVWWWWPKQDPTLSCVLRLINII